MKIILAGIAALIALASVTAAFACDCPSTSDVATFSMGTASNVTGDVWETPLLVSTVENGNFLQMRVNYDLSEGSFVDATSDVKNPGTIFIDNVESGASSYVVLQVVGGFGASCDQAVFYAQFERASSSVPVDLAYHTVEGGPNSYCHLNYSGGGDGKITPTDICFENGSAKGGTLAVQLATWTIAKELYR